MKVNLDAEQIVNGCQFESDLAARACRDGANALNFDCAGSPANSQLISKSIRNETNLTARITNDSTAVSQAIFIGDVNNCRCQ